MLLLEKSMKIILARLLHDTLEDIKRATIIQSLLTSTLTRRNSIILLMLKKRADIKIEASGNHQKHYPNRKNGTAKRFQTILPAHDANELEQIEQFSQTASLGSSIWTITKTNEGLKRLLMIIWPVPQRKTVEQREINAEEHTDNRRLRITCTQEKLRCWYCIDSISIQSLISASRKWEQKASDYDTAAAIFHRFFFKARLINNYVYTRRLPTGYTKYSTAVSNKESSTRIYTFHSGGWISGIANLQQ